MAKKKSVKQSKAKSSVKKKGTKKVSPRKAATKKKTAKKTVSKKTTTNKSIIDLDDKKKQAGRIAKSLAKKYPKAECALIHDSPFQLLVSTILSAQCTDERVNSVTPNLYKKYPSAFELAKAPQKSVEKIIHSLGFFRAKSTNIRKMAQSLVDDFDGEVPQTLEELTKLAGVGRKTANVVLGTAFEIPSGVVVDTHVKRICHLIGVTETKNPEIVERELMEILPKKEWINWSHRLVHHGRQICIARRPKCQECPLLKNCNRTDLPELV
jgi:endonuclease III